MKILYKWKYAIGGAVIILLGIVIWQISSFITSAEPITPTEAKQLVQDMYKGEIVEITEGRNIYVIHIQLDTGLYEIKINRSTGNIDAMKMVNNEVPSKENEEPTDSDHPAEELSLDEVKEILLQQQTINIEKVEKKIENNQSLYYAVVHQGNKETVYKLDAVSGDILDSTTTEIEQSKPKRITVKDAKVIALQAVNGEIDDVELEEEDGIIYYIVEIERNDEQDASVQINAITGEILSIVWDD